MVYGEKAPPEENRMDLGALPVLLHVHHKDHVVLLFTRANQNVLLLQV